jgi:hypothetical protein
MIAAGALAAVTGLGACGANAAPQDFSVPDAAADLAPEKLVLTVNGDARPLDAYYSLFVEPFSETGPTEVTLVVTLIDPAFTCAGAPSGLDAVSFGFAAIEAGVDTTGVFSRAGPTLGATTGGSGSCQLAAADARYLGEDGGAVEVSPGGRVAGEVHYQLAPQIRVDGPFSAPHCPALDFVASP